MTLNRPLNLLTLCAFSTLLAACATSEPKPSPDDIPIIVESPKDSPQPQLTLKLASGTYRCELGQKIEVERDKRDSKLIRIGWKGKRHNLQRYDPTSGLPRYEDRQAGLIWIDLPWKSVLMDAKTGHPLANECVAKG